MTISDREKKLLNVFENFSDWEQKYKHIIDGGKKLVAMDDKYRTDDYLVKGCQSQVWLFATLENQRIHFIADSDALIVKGLIQLLFEVYQDCLPAELIGADLSIFEKINLSAHLTPNRASGFQAMFKQMKMYAVAFHYQIHAGS